MAGGRLACGFVLRSLPAPIRQPAQRIANAVLRRWPRPFLTTSEPGFQFEGTTADVIQRHVGIFGVWEPNLTAHAQRHLRAGDTAVDIGANVGYYSCLFASLVGPHGRVVAFEPLPAAHDQLMRNLALNDFTGRVDVRQQAVGATPGRTHLFQAPADNIGSTTSTPVDDYSETESVEVVRIADVLSTDQLETLRLVKIDIEGDEMNALIGFGDWLHRLPDDCRITVEVVPRMMLARGQTPEQLMELMDSAGFRPFIVPNPYSPVDYAARGEPVPPQRYRGESFRVADFVFARSGASELS